MDDNSNRSSSPAISRMYDNQSSMIKVLTLELKLDASGSTEFKPGSSTRSLA